MSDFNWRDLFDFEEPEPEDSGPGAYRGRDHLAIARKLMERADLPRAFAKAVKAIEAWPTNGEAYVIAGDCLRVLDEDELHHVARIYRDEATAEDYYQAALLHEPDDGTRADILCKLGEVIGERARTSRPRRIAKRRRCTGRIGQRRGTTWPCTGVLRPVRSTRRRSWSRSEFFPKPSGSLRSTFGGGGGKTNSTISSRRQHGGSGGGGAREGT